MKSTVTTCDLCDVEIGNDLRHYFRTDRFKLFLSTVTTKDLGLPEIKSRPLDLCNSCGEIIETAIRSIKPVLKREEME